MTDTDARLAALKALADKATQRSLWTAEDDRVLDHPRGKDDLGFHILKCQSGWIFSDDQAKAHAALIAALRNDAIPLAEALMKERDEARAELADTKAILELLARDQNRIRDERDELKARIAYALL